MTVTAKVYLEVEITIEGTFDKGYAGSRDEPPEPSGFDDVRATGMAALVRDPNGDRDGFRRVNLLSEYPFTGAETGATILDNLLSAVGDDECQTALFAELPEEWD